MTIKIKFDKEVLELKKKISRQMMNDSLIKSLLKYNDPQHLN